jgi:spermidine synthase
MLWGLVVLVVGLISGCQKRSSRNSAEGPAATPAVATGLAARPVARPGSRPAVARQSPRPRTKPEQAKRSVDPDPLATPLPATLRRLGADEPKLRAGKMLSYPSRWNRQVYVKQKGAVRYLYLGRKDVIHTRMDMKHPGRLLSPYARCMLVALGYFADLRKEMRRAVMIGLGGGALTRFFHMHWPAMAFHSVEIDPVVVAVARQLFHVSETSTYRSYAMDGRRFVREAKKPYDLIVVDAFDAAATMPKQLASVEFFRLLKKRLTPHGVLVVNFLVHDRRIYSAVVRTVRSVFPAVARFPLRRMASFNSLLVAPADPGRRPKGGLLRRRVEKLGRGLGLTYSVKRCLDAVDSDQLVDPKGPLLRDPPRAR